MIRLALIAAGSAFLLAGTAHAQWTKRVDADAFTGKSVTFVEVPGKVLEGPAGTTSLVWREKDGAKELFWTAPVAYVCDSEMQVQVRFGDSDPEEAPVTISTSNKGVFFVRTWYTLWRMAETGKALVKLTDRCGNSSVVQFTGSPAKAFPELALDKSKGWTLVDGYVVKEQGGAGVKYRVLRDGRDDLSFFVAEPQTKGGDGMQLSGKTPPKAKVTFGGQTIDAKTYYGADYIDHKLIGNGRIVIGIGDALNRQKLIDGMVRDKVMTITYNGQTYSIDLDGYEAAAKLG